MCVGLAADGCAAAGLRPGPHNQECHQGDKQNGNDLAAAEAAVIEQEAAELIGDERQDITKDHLIADADRRPLAAAHFPAEGGHGHNAGRVKEVEDHVRECGERSKHSRNPLHDRLRVVRIGDTLQHRQGADRIFLRREGADRGDGAFPVAEPERSEYPADGLADAGQHAVFNVNHLHVPAECGQEPDEHRDGEDDRAGLDDEIPRPLPHVDEYALKGGDVVRRQFHDEGGRVAAKILRFFQGNARQHNDRDAEKIHGRRDQDRVREKGEGDHADDDHFRAAGYEGGEHERHAAVLFVFNRPGCHKRRHAAAGADQEREERFAGKAESAEYPVHDKGDPRHISRILQNGQEEKQDQHLRHKTEHRAHAADDAVHDQAGEPGSGIDGIQLSRDAMGDPVAEQRVVDPVRRDAAERRDGNIIHQEHDDCENRQGEDPVGHNAVDLVRSRHMTGILAQAFSDQLRYIFIPPVDDERLAVVAQFFFHRDNQAFQLFALAGR